MSRKSSSAIWKYLNETGVLERGDEKEIKAAKRAYRKNYFLEFKRRQRERKPEYNVCFNRENGEYQRISQAAKKHKLTVTAFIRMASFAYIERTYIVPDTQQVAKLELLLSECLNEIRILVSRKEKLFWNKDDKLHAIEKRIEKLEKQVNEVLRNPPFHSNNDRQNKNP